MSEFILHAGMTAADQSVIDERIKSFCCIPYASTDGIIEACSGILRNYFGCPPHAPSVDDTKVLLSKSRGFLILLFEGNEREFSLDKL